MVMEGSACLFDLVFVCACSVMSDSVTLWTVVGQAPLSTEFSKQEYRSRLPFHKLTLKMNSNIHSVQFSSVSQSCPTLCDPMNHSMPGLPVHHPNSWSLPKPMPIESVMPSSHLILGRPLLLLPPPSSIRVFSNESTLRMRWPKYWSFSFSITFYIVPLKSRSTPGSLKFR